MSRRVIVIVFLQIAADSLSHCTSFKSGHRSNLASLCFRVNAATERRKHTQVDFLWITRRFRTIAAYSDLLGAWLFAVPASWVQCVFTKIFYLAFIF